MDGDSGDEFSGVKTLAQATKRKFDYSFSSSSENEENADEEAKGSSDGDESADEIKQALFVQKPQPRASLSDQDDEDSDPAVDEKAGAGSIMVQARANQDGEDIPIHRKVIDEADMSAEEQQTARSFLSKKDKDSEDAAADDDDSADGDSTVSPSPVKRQQMPSNLLDGDDSS